MKNKLNQILLYVALFAFFASCNNAPKTNGTSEKQTHTEKEEDCSHVHWSYKGEEGPAHWQDLCSGFSACGGKVQSPINIETSKVVSDTHLLPIEISYQYTPVDIVNNGHTVQFNVSGNNSILLGGKTYQLLQFHYHALSEHTINGEHAPIEVHFVHRYSDTDLAVLGILFDEGESYELFQSYLNKFPKEKGHYTSTDSISLSSLLPKDLGYYSYNGSLTTPPCSELVSWYVLKEPLQASAEEINQFSNILHNNYRPVMPLNGRLVYAYN